MTLKTSDAPGTSSFTGSTNWSNDAPPSAGNDYFTANFTLRTPNPTTSGNVYAFGGDSLSLDPGGRLLGKSGNNGGVGVTASNTIIVRDLVLNGGALEQAGGTSGNAILTVMGNITVAAASMLGALGPTSDGNPSFETLDVRATLSGSAPLQVSGPVVNGGTDRGVVRLSAANPYGGTITVSNGNNGIIASAEHRILQLNHLNALSNATLNLDSVQANPVSFAAGANSGTFHVGALAGRSSQRLVDTAGWPVTVSAGANGASTVYSGALTGSGNLVKAGLGTLTLTGMNTHSGDTTISNGTVAVSGGGSLASSISIAVESGVLDVTGLGGAALSVAAGRTLSGIGRVNGSIAMTAGSSLSPGNGGVGTLTVLNDLTLSQGSSNWFELGASASGANDQMLVGGALACNNSVVLISASGGSANMDVSDYVLFRVTNGIAGACAVTPVFLGTPPANAAHYTVVTSGNTVVLRYNLHVPPTSVTTALPSLLARGQSTLISVTTAHGDGEVTGVVLDASAIGAGSAVPLVLNPSTANVWTNRVTVSRGTIAGSKTLTATVTDSHGLSSSSSVLVTVADSHRNPILPSRQADPHITYLAGEYWIYPTTSDTKSFRAFSSSNLVDWVDQGQIFNLSQSSWATNGYGWAPCVVHAKGNYYFYYAMGGAAGWQDSKLGVAIGPTPKGPFTDIGAPLALSQTSSPRVEAIDPMVFFDTDGKAYLYYGGSAGANLAIRQLNTNDMISFSSPLSVVTPQNFTEAPFMSKRNGIYYLSYSNGSWRTNTYSVRYATSSSPMGPWTYRGQILTSDSLRKGPGSHSFLQLPGTDTWYICYHYWDSVYSARHVALDTLNYNPDGTLKPVVMTGGGVVARWESYSVPGNFIVHTNGVGRLVDSHWADDTSQYLMVPGLADKSQDTVSFELIDKPDRYLRRNSSGQLVMDVWTDGGAFNADATFYLRPGLAGSADVSFESYRFPGSYLRRSGSLVYVQSGSGPAFESDATWKVWTANELSNLQIARTNNDRVRVTWEATWNGGGTLLEAANPNGPWVTNTSAVSPFVVNPINSPRFYRVDP